MNKAINRAQSAPGKWNIAPLSEISRSYSSAAMGVCGYVWVVGVRRPGRRDETCAMRRPLVLTGPPGVGKSMTAQA
jgi:hypothetical protein